MAIGGDGAVWLATDGGLFRITTAAGVLRGVVLDAAGRPVAGAMVSVLGTPFRTVTDGEGRFVLMNVPPGTHRVIVDGSMATNGPFTAVTVEVETATDERVLEPVAVTPRPAAASLKAVAGGGQTGPVGVPLPNPLVVVVQDATGLGIAKAPVTFAMTKGSGILASEIVLTDASGMAATTLTPTVADVIETEARVDGLPPVIFPASGIGTAGVE